MSYLRDIVIDSYPAKYAHLIDPVGIAKEEIVAETLSGEKNTPDSEVETHISSANNHAPVSTKDTNFIEPALKTLILRSGDEVSPTASSTNLKIIETPEKASQLSAFHQDAEYVSSNFESSDKQQSQQNKHDVKNITNKNDDSQRASQATNVDLKKDTPQLREYIQQLAIVSNHSELEKAAILDVQPENLVNKDISQTQSAHLLYSSAFQIPAKKPHTAITVLSAWQENHDPKVTSANKNRKLSITSYEIVKQKPDQNFSQSSQSKQWAQQFVNNDLNEDSTIEINNTQKKIEYINTYPSFSNPADIKFLAKSLDSRQQAHQQIHHDAQVMVCQYEKNLCASTGKPEAGNRVKTKQIISPLNEQILSNPPLQSLSFSQAGLKKESIPYQSESNQKTEKIIEIHDTHFNAAEKNVSNSITTTAFTKEEEKPTTFNIDRLIVDIQMPEDHNKRKKLSIQDKKTSVLSSSIASRFYLKNI